MAPIQTVTISREYGSGGAIIGKEIADRTGWKLLDRELIIQLARRAQVRPSAVLKLDEHPASLVERILKGFWRVDVTGWLGPTPEVLDADYLVELTAMVIQEAAKLGKCVIVGRGAQCVLCGRKDVFHVFVYGSRSERIKRVQSRYRTRGDCEDALESIDRTRAAYIRRYYQCDWSDRHLYHLMVNSDCGIEQSVSLIVNGAGLAQELLANRAASL